MIKSEVLKLYKKYNLFYPPRIIFDIWNDEDEIPNEMLIYFFSPPEHQHITLFAGVKFINEFESAIKEYINECSK